MRILYFGSTDGTSGALHYFTAMRRVGMDAVAFDPRYFEANNLGARLTQRLLKAPTPARISRVSRKLISLCRQNRFDAVFVMSENFLSGETIEEIKNGPNPPLFLYHSHDNNFSKGILKPSDFEQTLRAYDFLFTTKSQNVARYRQLGHPNAFFVPSAYEPTVHQPVSREKSVYRERNLQVTFVGTYDTSRERWCEAVGWHRLNVWGGYWKRSPKYALHPERIVPEPLYYFEFADILSSSLCTLGLLREEADDLHTQRTFEIPACGGFQVAPRNHEISKFFKDGKEIVLFDTPEELRDKVDYYLARETERERIARAGFERCTKGGHRYEDRIEEFLRIIQKEDRGLLRRQAP